MLYISNCPQQDTVCVSMQWPGAETRERKFLKMHKNEGDTDKELNIGPSSGTDIKARNCWS